MSLSIPVKMHAEDNLCVFSQREILNRLYFSWFMWLNLNVGLDKAPKNLLLIPLVGPTLTGYAANDFQPDEHNSK